MRKTLTWLIIILAACITATLAFGQDKRAPIVFITIDTSGSMNFTVDGRQMYDINYSSSGLCHSNRFKGIINEKSRLMLAKEALAGSVRNYTTCASARDGKSYADWGACHRQKVYRSYNVCNTDGCWNHRESMTNGDIYRKFSSSNSIPLVCPYFSDLNASDDKFYSDGLIQSYAASVKFGFAGFAYWANSADLYGKASSYTDGGITYYSPSITDPYKTITEAVGIWTAKFDTPAPLIYPPAFDSVSEIERTNARVVDMVRSYYAYGGTPTGPALADLYYVFTQDENVHTTPKSTTERHTDPFYSCRDKAIILVTDGEPSAGYNSTNPNIKGLYSHVWHDARRLYDAGIKTYIVGFAFTNLSAAARNMLNRTAWQGGTCRTGESANSTIHPTDLSGYNSFIDAGNNCFYDAATGDGLRIALVSVLTDMLRGKVSRTKAASTTRIGRLANGAKTGWYEVYSGYEVGQGNLWKSQLERETFVCSSEGFVRDESQFIDMAQLLQTRVNACKENENCSSDRSIWLGNYEGGHENAIFPEMIKIGDPNAGKLGAHAQFDYQESQNQCDIAMTQSIYASTDGAGQTINDNYILNPYHCATDFDCESEGVGRYCMVGKCYQSSQLSGLKRCADGCSHNEVCLANFCFPKATQCSAHRDCGINRVCHVGKCMPGVVRSCEYREFIASQPLGTIEYASPVIVGGPERSYASKSYQSFSKKHWLRDTMLYVGANDGMLHAFNLGKNLNTASSVAEGAERWAFIPKTLYPKLRDLLNFGKQSFVNAPPVAKDIFIPSKNEWRSVLVGGLRDGGRAYYALDVTDPDAPSVIWEISNTLRTPKHGTGSDEDEFGFANMGYSYGEAVITNLNIAGKIEPVAMVSAGFPSPGSYRESGEIGKALYVVRLDPAEDGSDLIVKTISFDKVVTGSPAVYPSGFNKTAQVLYVGDAAGRMHRIDFMDPNPNNWISLANADTSVIFDPRQNSGLIEQTYEPIYHKPAVGLLANNVLSVSFGTGMPDNLSIYGLTNNYFASFVDRRSCTGSYVDGKFVQHCEYKLNPTGAYYPKLLAFDKTSPDSLNVMQSGSVVHGVESKHTVYHMQDSQKITGAPLLFNYQIYVPSYQSEQSVDSCATGNAKVWRLSVTESGTKAGANHIASNINVQRPDSQSDYWKNDHNPNYFALGSDTVVYGLEVSPQNICITSSDPSGNMQAALASPQLILQTGENPHKNAPDIPGSSGIASPNRSTESLAIDLAPVMPRLTPLSWSSVYE
ncbi:MAG: PilC/PilY family type IV pilus protein [Bradymonadales bacterium]